MDTTQTAPLLPAGALFAGGPAETTATESRTAAEGDFETFLTLLTAQLRNQDPLQPLDSTEFVAQLASFSTVEQLIGTNERLDRLAGSGAAGDIAGLAGWIGRSASATDGRFRADGEERLFSVPSVAGASSAEAQVLDETGAILARIAVDPAEGEATWNGRSDAGAPVRDQTVRIAVFFETGEDLPVERTIPAFHPIIAIRGGPDGPLIERADGITLSPADIAELRAEASEE